MKELMASKGRPRNLDEMFDDGALADTVRPKGHNEKSGGADPVLDSLVPIANQAENALNQIVRTAGPFRPFRFQRMFAFIVRYYVDGNAAHPA
jgi:spore coat polysaccharide biosynthesis protein SpsF (cytidylyltransferase family)